MCYLLYVTYLVFKNLAFIHDLRKKMEGREPLSNAVAGQVRGDLRMAQAVACPCLRARYLQCSVSTGVVCVSSREWARGKNAEDFLEF